MSNSYFDFKQFRIMQDQCAMKVSTDACIQGAWTQLSAGNIHILDIGAGTGLLSLMLAQRHPQSMIDALEMDTAAAEQAALNVTASPFAQQITVHATDARTFAADHPYDLIICNPPFFKNSLHGPQAARNQARHNISLQQEDLLALMNHHLSPQGTASILWPITESMQWQELAARHGWVQQQLLSFRDKDSARISRTVGIYARYGSPAPAQLLSIKEPDGTYTAAFKALLQPFYLHL